MIVSGLIGQSGIFPENHLIVTEIDDRSGVGVFLKSLLSAFVAGGGAYQSRWKLWRDTELRLLCNVGGVYNFPTTITPAY